MFILTRSRAILLVCVASAFARTAPVPQQKEDPNAAELKKLEGTWEVESVTLGGRPFPKGDPPVQYEIKGSAMKVLKTEALWMLELDAAKDPKRATQYQAEIEDNKLVRSENGQINKAVYSLEKDKLTWVIPRGPNGEYLGEKAEFPKSVTPEAGEFVVVMVLKRVKK
jgi:uncharacterized protein (TIGR03067 family)